MSHVEDRQALETLIGERIESIEVIESGYGDGFTAAVELVVGGRLVKFCARSFNDGSSALDVDVSS